MTGLSSPLRARIESEADALGAMSAWVCNPAIPSACIKYMCEGSFRRPGTPTELVVCREGSVELLVMQADGTFRLLSTQDAYGQIHDAKTYRAKNSPELSQVRIGGCRWGAPRFGKTVSPPFNSQPNL